MTWQHNEPGHWHPWHLVAAKLMWVNHIRFVAMKTNTNLVTFKKIPRKSNHFNLIGGTHFTAH